MEWRLALSLCLLLLSLAEGKKEKFKGGKKVFKLLMARRNNDTARVVKETYKWQVGDQMQKASMLGKTSMVVISSPVISKNDFKNDSKNDSKNDFKNDSKNDNKKPLKSSALYLAPESGETGMLVLKKGRVCLIHDIAKPSLEEMVKEAERRNSVGTYEYSTLVLHNLKSQTQICEKRELNPAVKRFCRMARIYEADGEAGASQQNPDDGIQVFTFDGKAVLTISTESSDSCNRTDGKPSKGSKDDKSSNESDDDKDADWRPILIGRRPSNNSDDDQDRRPGPFGRRPSKGGKPSNKSDDDQDRRPILFGRRPSNNSDDDQDIRPSNFGRRPSNNSDDGQDRRPRPFQDMRPSNFGRRPSKDGKPSNKSDDDKDADRKPKRGGKRGGGKKPKRGNKSAGNGKRGRG